MEGDTVWFVFDTDTWEKEGKIVKVHEYCQTKNKESLPFTAKQNHTKHGTTHKAIRVLKYGCIIMYILNDQPQRNP